MAVIIASPSATVLADTSSTSPITQSAPKLATEGETTAMIRRAPTDSERHVSYDPLARPAVGVALAVVPGTRNQRRESLHPSGTQ